MFWTFLKLKMKSSYNLILHLVVSRGLASFGAALTGFGLDVWIYKNTGSYETFASITALAFLPPIMFSTLAGYAVDKFNRGKILAWCETFTISIMVLGLILKYNNNLTVYAIAMIVFFLSVINEFRYTAITALIPELASKEKLVALGGIQNIFRGLTMLSAPFFSAILLEKIGLESLFMSAILLCIYAQIFSYLLKSKFITSKENKSDGFCLKSFAEDYKNGIYWLKDRRELKILLIYFSVLTGTISLFGVINAPRILDLSGTYWLAIYSAAQGSGILVGGMILIKSFFKNTESRNLILIGSYALGICMMATSLSKSMYSIATLGFFIGVSISIVSTGNQVLWQEKTPNEINGKLIAIRSLFLYICSPIIIFASAKITPILSNLNVHIIFFDLLSEKNAWLQVIQLASGVLILLIVKIFQISTSKMEKST